MASMLMLSPLAAAKVANMLGGTGGFRDEFEESAMRRLLIGGDMLGRELGAILGFNCCNELAKRAAAAAAAALDIMLELDEDLSPLGGEEDEDTLKLLDEVLTSRPFSDAFEDAGSRIDFDRSDFLERSLASLLVASVALPAKKSFGLRLISVTKENFDEINRQCVWCKRGKASSSVPVPALCCAWTDSILKARW